MTIKFWPAVKWALAIASAMALIWLGAACNSGAFLARNDWAVAPEETTRDVFTQQKQEVQADGIRIAYFEAGRGPPLILLHGCPFSAYEWREIIPILARTHRVIAPDLIGLGDTPVRLDQDYRLPRQVAMVRALMDHLGIARADFVAHDHGGATVLLMMNSDPERLGRVVLTNIEAYDQWPSKPELPYLQAITNPVTSPFLYLGFHTDWLQREALGLAFHEPGRVSQETYRALMAPHIATPARWQRLRRFLSWQMDAAHNRLTMEALPGMRGFQRPVLLLWGAQDENFGPPIALRLVHDIPGAVGVRWFRHSAHMPMLEEPTDYAESVLGFMAGEEPNAENFDAASTLRAREPTPSRRE